MFRLMELANAESQRADPDQDDDDDAEYYRDEVGAEPDKGMCNIIHIFIMVL